MYSGRIILLFMLNLTYFVYTFYSGSLVSSLLNVPFDPINNVEDLMKADFKIGIENNRFNKEYFKYTVDNASMDLYQLHVKNKEDKVYLKPEDGLKQLKDDYYAFHIELAKAYPYIQTHFKEDICKIRQVAMYSPPKCYANYAKHSAFRDTIDICLHRIAESGMMKKEQLFWQNKQPQCVYPNNIHTGLDELYPVLLLVLMGILFGIINLALEIVLVKIFINLPLHTRK